MAKIKIDKKLISETSYKVARKMKEEELRPLVRTAKKLIRNQVFGTDKQKGIIEKYYEKLLKNPMTAVPNAIAQGLQRGGFSSDGKKIEGVMRLEQVPTLKSIRDMDILKSAKDILYEERAQTIERNKVVLRENKKWIDEWRNITEERFEKLLSRTANGRNGYLELFTDLRKTLTMETITEKGFKEYKNKMMNKFEESINKLYSEDIKSGRIEEFSFESARGKDEYFEVLEALRQWGAFSTAGEFYEKFRNLVQIYRQGVFNGKTYEQLYNEYEELLSQYVGTEEIPEPTLEIIKR